MKFWPDGFKTHPWACGYDWVITIIVIIVFFLLANVISRAEDVDPEKHQPGMTYVPDIKMPGLHKTNEKPKKREKQSHQSNHAITRSAKTIGDQNQNGGRPNFITSPIQKPLPPPEVVMTIIFRIIRDLALSY